MSLRFGMPLAAVTLAMFAGSAHAVFVLGNGDSVTLAQLQNSSDHQFQVMDKLFTILTYTSATVSPNDVSVTGFISANPQDGIGFDLTGGFGDVPGDGQITDMNLHYTVEVVNPQLSQGIRIKDLGLTFNGTAVGTGSFARVDELVFDPNAPTGMDLVGSRHVFANAGPPATSQQQDAQTFASTYSKLEVNKDIQFFAVGDNSQAAASFVRQSFSQTPTPGGVALAGIAGLLLARRRR
jgi:MYXO-CTERM domain-containing protein